MAGPIAHIFCALSVLASGALKVTDERAFILGVSYPNMHIVDLIKKEKKPLPHWQQIVNEPSDFKKGMLLHAIIDDLHDTHIAKRYANHMPRLPVMKQQIISYFEDAQLYYRVTDWPRIMGYFDTIITEERTQHSLPDLAINKWHQFIKTYCAQQPSALSTHMIFNQFPILRNRIPLGLPSLASKAYVGIAFKTLKKQAYLNALSDFYDQSADLIIRK